MENYNILLSTNNTIPLKEVYLVCTQERFSTIFRVFHEKRRDSQEVFETYTHWLKGGAHFKFSTACIEYTKKKNTIRNLYLLN